MSTPETFETTVEQTASGEYTVFVHTMGEDGARKQETGVYPTQEKAEQAASLIAKGAKRYEDAGDSSPSAPDFADPAQS